MTFVEGAVTFIGKGSLAIKRRLFETAGVRVIDNVEGVGECDLKW